MNLEFTPSIYYSGQKAYDESSQIESHFNKTRLITSEPIIDLAKKPIDLLKLPPEKYEINLEDLLSNKYHGFVWDDVLFKKHGAKSKIDGTNNGEITINGGTKKEPDVITYTDRSTGKERKYTYRKITPEEIATGKLSTGENISKEQFKPGETYYVLVSVEGAKKSNHVEIYRLFISEKGGICHLYQDKGMDGAGKSSIDMDA